MLLDWFNGIQYSPNASNSFSNIKLTRSNQKRNLAVVAAEKDYVDIVVTYIDVNNELLMSFSPSNSLQ